eukprot:307341_1
MAMPIQDRYSTPERPEGSESDAFKGPGRLLILGSMEIFGDVWIDEEENRKLCGVLFQWLLNDSDIALEEQKHYDLSGIACVPNTEALADRLQCCLQESEELPKDLTKLFDESLFKFDTLLIPDAIELYGTLGLKHEPLTLIPPTFECPLPTFNPAVFPPILREPPPPALD